MKGPSRPMRLTPRGSHLLDVIDQAVPVAIATLLLVALCLNPWAVR